MTSYTNIVLSCLPFKNLHFFLDIKFLIVFSSTQIIFSLFACQVNIFLYKLDSNTLQSTDDLKERTLYVLRQAHLPNSSKKLLFNTNP